MSRKELHTIRVGGVPEHFNTPWHTAAASGRLEKAGVKVEWTEFPGGTGAMTKALRDRQVDVAILLTEGIVADLHKGSDAKLLGTYVSTPLCWGVHVGARSTLESMEDLHENKGRYAVSRMGSGSHLMALVDVRTRLGDAAAAALQFEIVGGLSGAKDALKQSAELAFMWEKFTTKPLVDSGDLKRIGEVYTPWPCFLLAATPEALATPQPLIAMLNAVQAEANELRARSNAAQVGERSSASFRDAPHIPPYVTPHFPAYSPYVTPHFPCISPTPLFLHFFLQVIGDMYGLKYGDVQEWLMSVRWSCTPSLSLSMLEQVQAALVEAAVLEPNVLRPPKELLAPITEALD